MIGYILFYELPIIIRWQWRLCCAMSAMLGYPDFCSYRWQWMLCCAMSAMLGYPDFRSYEWQRILCYAMRHFSCSNCVAVMLLKARGWRGTSLPRGRDNVWFSNPVRVLLLPITWRIRKSWTRSGFISCVYFSPRWLTSLANVGLSKAQLVPSCLFISRLLSCYMVIMMKQ